MKLGFWGLFWSISILWLYRLLQLKANPSMEVKPQQGDSCRRGAVLRGKSREQRQHRGDRKRAWDCCCCCCSYCEGWRSARGEGRRIWMDVRFGQEGSLLSILTNLCLAPWNSTFNLIAPKIFVFHRSTLRAHSETWNFAWVRLHHEILHFVSFCTILLIFYAKSGPKRKFDKLGVKTFVWKGL